MADNFDLDAILKSVTTPSEPTSDEKPDTTKSSDAQLAQRLQNDGSGFRIDPRSAHITGTDDIRRDANAVTVNPEDFRNQVQMAAEKKRTKKLFIAFLSLLGIAGIGYLAYTFIPVATGGGLEQPRPAVVNANEAVLAQFYEDAPALATDVALSAAASPTGVWLTNGDEPTYHLTFAGMDFQITDRTVKGDEFGLIATAQVAGPWNGTQIYAFKDMIRSKVFAQGWDRDLMEVEGSPVAAVMFLELAAEVHAVVAVANPDSSGFLIVLPTNLNYASALNLADFVRVE